LFIELLKKKIAAGKRKRMREYKARDHIPIPPIKIKRARKASSMSGKLAIGRKT